eukprot:14169419-Ditylum_brightwellii.AAC.1
MLTALPNVAFHEQQMPAEVCQWCSTIGKSNYFWHRLYELCFNVLYEEDFAKAPQVSLAEGKWRDLFASKWSAEHSLVGKGEATWSKHKAKH